MTTIIDYVQGAVAPLRADLTPADALALCALVNVDFHALPGPRSARGCALREVARASSIRALYRHAMVTHRDRPLLEAVGASPRFRDLLVRHAVTRLVSRPLAQFGAATFVDGSGAAYVVFRGTDASSVGFAEDARFGLDFPTDSQRWAARYLRFAAEHASGPVSVLGHSKGGNLALYAAAAATPGSLEHVYACDPVGFPAQVVDSGLFSGIAALTSAYVTAGSWVSPLLPLPVPTTVVDSSWPGPLSHNPYAWLTQGPQLRRDSRDRSRSGALLARVLHLALRVRPTRINEPR
ncbi:DUF2974 domain-containing protein [Schaalia meyeri]|uniref:DUF2974 domain-containing protein n=1 Tax=Schaalia meyeri TaxID=52773 RepID=A0AAP9Y6E9_9ACTO|nr:Mbeg1-like protein [Schaalia meyeri]QQC43663.1 DUF2974 domain-containing protein [Schaalia meyeri]SDS18029.1 Protein of unknown function [Schaalia meyeri]